MRDSVGREPGEEFDGWLDECSSDEDPSSGPGEIESNGAVGETIFIVSESDANGEAGLPRSVPKRATAVDVKSPPAVDGHDEGTDDELAGDTTTTTHDTHETKADVSREETSSPAPKSYRDFSVKSPLEKTAKSFETVLRAWLRSSLPELAKGSFLNTDPSVGGVNPGLRGLRATIPCDFLPTGSRGDALLAVTLYYPPNSPPNVFGNEKGNENSKNRKLGDRVDTKGTPTGDSRNASYTKTIGQRAHAPVAASDDLGAASTSNERYSGLQRWFGVGTKHGSPFLVVEPSSFAVEKAFFSTNGARATQNPKSPKRTFADVDDASFAKAAVAVACTAVGVPPDWVVFAPVLGPKRGAFVGRTGDGGDQSLCDAAGQNNNTLNSGWSVRYETDSLCGVSADTAQARTLIGLAEVLKAQLLALGGQAAADLVNRAKACARLTFLVGTRWRSVASGETNAELSCSDEDASASDGGTSTPEKPGNAFLALAQGATHFPSVKRLKKQSENELDSGDGALNASDDEKAATKHETETPKKVKERHGDSDAGAWDDHEPWAPWCYLRDPWARVEVDAVWREVPLRELCPSSSGLDGAGILTQDFSLKTHETVSEPLSFESAPEWCVRAVPVGAVVDLDTGDSTHDFSEMGSGNESETQGQYHDAARKTKSGLAELFFRLSASAGAFAIRDADTMGQLASFEFWDDKTSAGGLNSSTTGGMGGANTTTSTIPRTPPESTIQDALRDVFEGEDFEEKPKSSYPPTPDATAALSCFPTPQRSAPPHGLLARIALHALVLGNPRAVAVLWRRLVREIRFAHWDRGVVLPRVGGFGCEQRAARRRRGKFPQKNSGAKKTEDSNNSSDDETEDDTAAKVFMDEQVDQNACLLHQKIQLINACIRRRGVNSENERKASDAAREKAIALKARIAEQSVTKKSSTNASVGWEDELGGWDVFDKHTRDTTTPTVRSVDDDIDLVALLGETSGLSVASDFETAGDKKTRSGTTADQTPVNTVAGTDGFETASDGGDDEGLGVDVVDPDHCEPEGIEKQHPKGLTLLTAPHSKMNVPRCQPPPMYTSDTHREREQSMHALGDTAEGRAVRLKVQSAVLVSDMSAFKAANPMCCLADFIRWHSPRDWEEEKTENGTEEEGSTFANKKDEEGIRLENKEDEEQHSQQPKKPPNGVLSKRMRSENNAWRALWREAPRQPACKQKKLFDPTLEGEKALEYLDQAPPPEIFVQLLAAAASAIGGVYASSSGANFSSSQEALRRAFQMTTHVFNKAVPYEHEYASVAGELQRAERAVCRGSALVHRLPKVSRDVLDALLTSAATDEAAGDLSVEAFCETAGETAGETADVTPSETPRVTRPPPKALETTLSRRHSERARGSALACLLPETTGAKNADSLPVHDIASSAEYTVLAGGGHNQTHRAHAVVAPCFLRVSSAVAYQY